MAKFRRGKAKFWFITISIVCGLGLVGGLIGGLVSTKKKLGAVQTEKPTTVDGSMTLNEWVTESTKDLKLSMTASVTLEMSDSGATYLSTETTPNVTVNGNGKVLKVTGAVKGAIKAVDGGALTFRNVIFSDVTTGGVYSDYLGFGGKVNFENCTFTSSIYLMDDITANFKDCKIKVTEKERYGVWVADGSASFTGCTFEGTRALKIHEKEAEKGKEKEADDVVVVSVEKCTFNRLSEKPGVVIGDIINNPSQTTISVRNSKFIDCYAWDKVGSIAGVDGCFETDTETGTFNFILKSNTVQFTPGTYAVAYYGIVNGEKCAIPTSMYKADGNYPTEYEGMKGAEIDDLQDSDEYGFKGWYLDKSCEKEFDGKISVGSVGNMAIYAKLSALWTKFY